MVTLQIEGVTHWQNNSLNKVNILQKAINITSHYIAPEKEFQDAFAGIKEVLITHITNMGEASTMLHKGIDEGNNDQFNAVMAQILLFCNNLKAKRNLKCMTLVVLEVVITFFAIMCRFKKF